MFDFMGEVALKSSEARFGYGRLTREIVLEEGRIVKRPGRAPR